MTLNSDLGEGMAQVAGNAILAHSIARQASALADARHSLDAMTQYATKLEGNVRQLHQLVIADSELIDALKRQVESLESDREEMARENEELKDRINRLVANGHRRGELFDRQVDFMRDLKDRLQQTEKELQHASGLAAAGEVILERLVEVDSRSAEEHRIARNLAYAAFCASGRLSVNDQTQQLLENLKIKAPDFKEGVAN